jgi:hypothetical protein
MGGLKTIMGFSKNSQSWDCNLSMGPPEYEANCKGKAIPLQTMTGPEGSKRLRHPYCKTIGT